MAGVGLPSAPGPKVGKPFATVDAAPFGLDFEMPEELWVLMHRIGKPCAAREHGLNLMFAWKSEDAVWAAAQQSVFRDTFLAESCPYRSTFDELREIESTEPSLLPPDGIVLLGEDFCEIGRRYFR